MSFSSVSERERATTTISQTVAASLCEAQFRCEHTRVERHPQGRRLQASEALAVQLFVRQFACL